MDEGGRTEANFRRKRGLSQGSGSEDASERVVRRKIDQEGFKVLVKFKEGHDIKSVGPVALTKYLREKVGEVIRARVHSDGDLMIVCKDERQQVKALKLKSVCKKEVLEVKERTAAGGVSRGVIYGIPVNEDLGKLKEGIEGGRAVSLKRLKAWRAGEKVDNLSVLVEFQGEVLPRYITGGYLNYNVRMYEPPPLRCFKCQKYGHIAAYCKGTQACGRCGGEHDYGACGTGVREKCVNSGGAHSVGYRECEARKRAAEIQHVRAEGKVSYAEAVKRVQAESNFERQPARGGKPSDGDGEILIVKKKEFLCFMVEVINCTAQAKHRAEKIAIVVKSAARYLGITDITVESIYEELQNREPTELPASLLQPLVSGPASIAQGKT
ncbi:unnamed protein product [Knipowitschia caucasica]